MMKHKIHLGCVIMASGLGRRFGGNKLTAPFHGGPMIGRILNETEALFEKRIVVTRHHDVAKLCREMRIDRILHSFPGRNDTIRLGLEAVQDGLDGCMFCPGDMPLLRRESLAMLADAFAEQPEFIWRLGGSAPVIFPAWAFDELKHLPENAGGAHVMRAHPEKLRSIMPVNPDELLDADTPEMLLDLDKLFSKGD